MRQDLEAFIKDLEINPDVKQGTVQRREADLKTFDEWLTENGIEEDLVDIKPSTIRSHLIERKQNYAATTVKSSYDSIKELYSHALIDYPSRENPVRKPQIQRLYSIQKRQ